MSLLRFPNLRNPYAINVSLVRCYQIEPTARQGCLVLGIDEDLQKFLPLSRLCAQAAVQHEHAQTLPSAQGAQGR